MAGEKRKTLGVRAMQTKRTKKPSARGKKPAARNDSNDRVVKIVHGGTTVTLMATAEHFPPIPDLKDELQSAGYICDNTRMVTEDRVTVVHDNTIVGGNYCYVKGNKCVINGDNNDVYGDDCVVNGNNCRVWGNLCIIKGDHAVIRGAVRQISGKHWVLDGGSVLEMTGGSCTFNFGSGGIRALPACRSVTTTQP